MASIWKTVWWIVGCIRSAIVGYSLGGSWNFSWESSLSDPSLKLAGIGTRLPQHARLNFSAAPSLSVEAFAASSRSCCWYTFLVVRDIEDDWYSTRDLVDVFGSTMICLLNN